MRALRTAIARYELPADRVRTIHLGIDHARFTPDGRTRQPFVLYPANRWPHKNHDRLFDAFYTTKPDGLGMGLAISRSVVESHGGRMWATANTPHGAVFRFTLPIGRAA